MARRRVASVMLAGLMLMILSVGNVLAGAYPPLVLFKNAPLVGGGANADICPGIIVMEEFTGKRSATVFFTPSGDDWKFVIDVQYWATFTNAADPELTLRSPGHRHIVFDFIADTYTDTGVYRNVTAPGQGTVLQQTGRWLASGDETIVYAIAGPHEDWLGQVEGFCEALGG